MIPLKLRVFISQSKYVGVCIHAHVGIYEDACVVCVGGGSEWGPLFKYRVPQLTLQDCKLILVADTNEMRIKRYKKTKYPMKKKLAVHTFSCILGPLCHLHLPHL